jgi:hypothetical protein
MSDLSLSATIFLYAWIFFFSIMTILRFLKKYLGDHTLMQRELASYIDDPDGADFQPDPSHHIHFSVLYRCCTDVWVIREQITCLSHLLASAFPKPIFYEFICLVTPQYKYLLTPLARLSLQFSGVRIYRTRCDSHFNRFVLATAYARGQIILDAQPLIYEIDNLASWKNRAFVKFARPLNGDDAFSIPVAGQKAVLMKILKGLHLMNFGAYFELNLLCYLHKIEVFTEERRFGPEKESMAALICHRAMKFYMERMYLWGCWTPGLD